jgi:hypothetical protein
LAYLTTRFKRSSAPVAQLDRVPDYESVGRKFESCRARHILDVKKGDNRYTVIPFFLSKV